MFVLIHHKIHIPRCISSEKPGWRGGKVLEISVAPDPPASRGAIWSLRCLRPPCVLAERSLSPRPARRRPQRPSRARASYATDARGGEDNEDLVEAVDRLSSQGPPAEAAPSRSWRAACSAL